MGKLSKTIKPLIQDNAPLGRDLNPETPENEAGALSACFLHLHVPPVIVARHTANLLLVTVRGHIKGLTYWSPNFYGKGPQPLLWTGLWAARGKIKISGTPTRVNFNNTVEPGYNDVGLCETPSKASDILWYQLIPHC
jgi:hypothetical protein